MNQLSSSFNIKSQTFYYKINYSAKTTCLELSSIGDLNLIELISMLHCYYGSIFITFTLIEGYDIKNRPIWSKFDTKFVSNYQKQTC